MADSTTEVYSTGSLKEVSKIIEEKELTFPLWIRPAFPLGGVSCGWSVAWSESEVEDVAEKAFQKSPVDEINIRNWPKVAR